MGPVLYIAVCEIHSRFNIQTVNWKFCLRLLVKFVTDQGTSLSPRNSKHQAASRFVMVAISS